MIDPCEQCIVRAMCKDVCYNLMDYWRKKAAEEFKNIIDCDIIECITIEGANQNE